MVALTSSSVMSGFLTAQPVLNPGVQDLLVDVDELAFQGATDVEANAVADLVFLIFQLRIGRPCERRDDKRRWRR